MTAHPDSPGAPPPLPVAAQSDFSWRGKRVLVTGAAGFIGSHLTERLVNLGAEVTAFIRYNSSGSRGLLDTLPLPAQQKLQYLYGDLCDPTALHRMGECNVVFHLAAMITIPFSYQQPWLVCENNYKSTLNLLEWCRSRPVTRLVHTSSSEVYGTAQQDFITEAHPQEAQSPYAASKIASDKLVQSYHLSFDVPAVTLRPFNTYGPRQSARAIIPTIITQALTQDKVFLGAQHPTRDFSFVSDTVDGFIRIAETPGIEGQTYHIGSGREISIGQLADRIIALSGRGAQVMFDPTRIRPTASEVNRLICDAARAKADLGWEPRVSLDEGLRQTIDWIGRNLRGYRPETYAV
jgi:dTDP-glucose 4,6-dehydratase